MKNTISSQTTLKLAAIQFDIVWEDQDANYALVSEMISTAKKAGAELVCLPELFSTGVLISKTAYFSETLQGKTVIFLSEQAKKNNVHLLGSLILKDDHGDNARPKNACLLFSPQGELLLTYCKRHLFSFGTEKESYSSGEDLFFFKLKGFTIMPLICYDLRFPEDFRYALSNGVNVFIIPANWPNPRKEHWCTLLKSRAIENQAYVIGINRIGNSPDLTFFGSSQIIDPQGNVISDADSKQIVIMSELKLDEIDSWRRRFVSIKDRILHAPNIKEVDP